MGCVRSGSKYRWKRRIIRFRIKARDFPTGSAGRRAVQRAIDHWNKKTVIQLVRRTNQRDFVVFVDNDACSSKVGRQGGRQEIACDLDSGSFGVGSVIHEIGHAAGLWHEHTRQDRNRFVIVNLSNVKRGKRHNFKKHVRDGDDIGAYDFGSIMHYGRRAFAIDTSRDTITPRRSVRIGQRTALSSGDVDTIVLRYGHSDAYCDALASHRGALLTAFFHPRTNNGWGIYRSPDGRNLGGGGATERVYAGRARVDAMVASRNGIITAFYSPSSRNPWGIYRSPNGRNLGGGGATERVYAGRARVDAMVAFGNGVITAFYSPSSRNPWGVYFSPNGRNLGGMLRSQPSLDAGEKSDFGAGV